MAKATLVDKYFSKNDLDAIEAAIKRAESKTSGEIVLMMANFSKNWHLERAIVAVVLSLATFVVAVYASRTHNWGSYYDFSQGALWGMVAFLAAYFGIGRLLFNRGRRRRIVWHHALAHFHLLSPTKGKTGVLVFVSLEEDQAAVVADAAIASKVPPDYWHGPQGIIQRSIKECKHAEGIVQAIDDIGDHLAEHFPREADDVNELPDAPQIV